MSSAVNLLTQLCFRDARATKATFSWLGGYAMFPTFAPFRFAE
jgi:hypothetical protein